MSTPLTNAPGSSWWRRNRGWLAGALVLGVLALVLPWRAAQHEYGRRGYDKPVEAVSGSWTEYAGSRWRLVDVLRDDGVSAVAGEYMHPEASLLVLVYDVIPGKGVTAQRLDRCNGQLTDVHGRVWGGREWGLDPSSLPEPLSRATVERAARALGLETGCGSRGGIGNVADQARPTRPFRFYHLYLIPRRLPARGLRGEIVLEPYTATPPGSFLRFTLAGSRPLPVVAASRN